METTKKLEVFSNDQLNNNLDNILDTTTAFENVKPEEEIFLWNKLPNELLINILRYLPHSDLQQIRLVCKLWHHITQLPEFVNKSKLIITNENMDSIHTCLMNDAELSSRLSYNSLELHDLDESDSLQLILKSVGSNIRKLRLYKSSIYTVTYDCLPDLEELIVCRLWRKKCTKEFSLDLSKFKRFKSLNIESCYTTEEMLPILERGVPMKIENFSFHLDANYDECLIYHLQNNATSLKHLEIILHTDPAIFSKWKQVFTSFRQLKSCKICGAYNEQWIKALMECLPKETSLRNLSINGGTQLTDSCLQQIVQKWPESLENIELMFYDGLTNVGVKELGILRHNLKSLKILRCNKVSPLGLLQGLAAETNNILKTLTLNSVTGMDPMSMGLLAQRLPQLTYLSLESCGDSVDDFTLKQIFRHQRKLQHLILDECKFITDEGILGFGANPASIRNLKGLQTLSLMGCSNLSNRTLITGLKFNELRKLVLGYCYKITSMGIGELVKNCSALEDLTISSCLRIRDDAMLHIAQGLRRLKCLNVSNCNKLTGKSIVHLVEVCKSLKEITMYDIDSLEIKKVQQKCLQLKPKIFILHC